MRRRWPALLGAFALLPAGCKTGPLSDNPAEVRPLAAADPACATPNPILLSPGQPGPAAYDLVFSTTLSVVSEYFVVAGANRYDGTIETLPRVAPGFEQVWKASSPSAYERLLATLQSMRHRALVKIAPGDTGGYLVQVTVYKELEDLAYPTRTNTPPLFSEAPVLQRQFDVIDETVEGRGWIPKGRDPYFEQAILHKIQRSLRGD